jgi:Glycosyl transferase family 2
MKTAELVEFSAMVLRNIGRPRRFAIVGCAEDLAQGIGAQIGGPYKSQAFAVPKGEKLSAMPDALDCAVLNLDGSVELHNFLTAAKRHLVDGGHALIYTTRGVGPSRTSITTELERDGFEVMRFDGIPGALRPIAETMLTGIGTSEFMQVSAQMLMRQITNPIEMLMGSSVSEQDAAASLVVARKRPQRGKLSLTVGMLTLNEEESVEKMINEIRAVAPDAKLMLIDSSSDSTPEIARKLGATVVRQLPPRGHGPAMERLMYEAAVDTEALIHLDCDFTYPTADIPRILGMLEEGADFVNASRVRHRPEAMPLPNFIANRLFAGAAQLAHGVPTTDVHSGMRGVRLSMARAFAFGGERDALPLDTLILPARSNYHCVEYAIPYYERVGVSKLQKLSGTLWTFGRIAAAYRLGTRVQKGRRYTVE